MCFSMVSGHVSQQPRCPGYVRIVQHDIFYLPGTDPLGATLNHIGLYAHNINESVFVHCSEVFDLKPAVSQIFFRFILKASVTLH